MTICYLKIKSFFDADLVQEKFEKGRGMFWLWFVAIYIGFRT